MIILKQVFKTYKNGTNALNGISLTIEQGEFVYIIGPTGSGKSTIIRLINGEEIPTKGIVEVAGVNVGKLRHSKVPLYRRNLGVVFQDFKLLEQKTVFENVLFALEVVNAPTIEARKRAREACALVGLSDKLTSFPHQLSGGQQQRVAIARAIANQPKVLICDEPTGNLDPAKSKEIIDILEKINREYHTTILMVTHAQILVNNYRRRTIALSDGYLVSDLSAGGYNE
ncbi:MAG: ATP-binding cassette domain-containing protein [Erysipelothrix sp.]|jgi:cell division transport system ATP-binding protein|nr:ATP-binding cassette domain-containing protein [Erysipelothrix sp.]